MGVGIKELSSGRGYDARNDQVEQHRHQMPLGSVLKNAARLRCPRCGEGRLYAKWFAMEKTCTGCGLDIAKKPGYYLGSTYINYGFTSVSLLIAYVGGSFGAGIEDRILVPCCVSWAIVFPLSFFRHARALWLGIDTLIDRPPE